MAADDRAPLLKHDENEFDPFETSRKNLRKLINSNEGAPSETISISGSASVTTLTELDNIVAVFVVAFDIRSGNVIEWCVPDDTDLDGVEFKAMVSGSHTQDTDFVYFRKDNYYGLACFENMRIQSEIERGCRMKSVGILATSYTTLYRHMQFLETQVRHLLETPGKYMQLKVFYDDRKGVIPLNEITMDSLRPSPLSTPSTPSRDLLPEMKITHPAGCFSQFLQFFGNQIFVLWKLALLQRRILFFSPPPIGIVCYRVYCACCLGHHNITNIMGQNPQPHFYVNVADIEALENEVSYIACTTEKIFESKTHLYDVYVDNQIVKVNSPGLKEILKVSDADKDKAVQLNNQRASHRFEVEELGEEQGFDEEDVFTNFFVEMNDRIFQMLLEISNSQDRQLTSDHMKTMGLDPQGDRSFLMELVEHYGIDVVLMVDNPCCPK